MSEGANIISDNKIEILYAGALKEQLHGAIGEWDVILLARYPDRRAFYEMAKSNEYQAIHHLREEALEKAVLWSSDPLLPFRTQTTEFSGGQWLSMPEDVLPNY